MPEVRKVSLGRMAVFLIPVKKLTPEIENRIDEFLITEYGGYTASTTLSIGWWRGGDGERHYDEHKEYKASFLGKERIAVFDRFIAELARDLGEECIYVETGEDSWTIGLVSS